MPALVKQSELDRARAWLDASFVSDGAGAPAALPLSCRCGDRPASSVLGDWSVQGDGPRTDDGVTRQAVTFTDPRTALSVPDRGRHVRRIPRGRVGGPVRECRHAGLAHPVADHGARRPFPGRPRGRVPRAPRARRPHPDRRLRAALHPAHLPPGRTSARPRCPHRQVLDAAPAVLQSGARARRRHRCHRLVRRLGGVVRARRRRRAGGRRHATHAPDAASRRADQDAAHPAALLGRGRRRRAGGLDRAGPRPQRAAPSDPGPLHAAPERQAAAAAVLRGCMGRSAGVRALGENRLAGRAPHPDRVLLDRRRLVRAASHRGGGRRDERRLDEAGGKLGPRTRRRTRVACGRSPTPRRGRGWAWCCGSSRSARSRAPTWRASIPSGSSGRCGRATWTATTTWSTSVSRRRGVMSPRCSPASSPTEG